MQWGQIKSLLILSFLVLDIYLFLEFLEKKEEADIGILEQQSSTIEERLEAEAITFNKLPEQEYEEAFISVKQQVFTEDELKKQNKLMKQKPYIFNRHFIASKIEEPIKLKENESKEKITERFKELVYYPEEYTFWNWNKELNVIIFFQNKMNRPVYYNQNGLVLLFVNEDNEISFYVQTMLGEAEPLAEKRKLIKPIQSIETLYKANEISSGDHISSVKIGFHTRVPFETGVQVFAPIWKVNVNDEKDYFVNAIEGFTFSTEENKFLMEVITHTIDRLDQQRGQETAIELMYIELKERVNVSSELMEHRGEFEDDDAF